MTVTNKLWAGPGREAATLEVAGRAVGLALEAYVSFDALVEQLDKGDEEEAAKLVRRIKRRHEDMQRAYAAAQQRSEYAHAATLVTTQVGKLSELIDALHREAEGRVLGAVGVRLRLGTAE